jgi:hypothetical protein
MSKTLQFSVFTNLRLASMTFTPAHSKNGVNISQRLAVNAFMNENRRGSSDDKSKAISLTAWSTGADILAHTLTDGKEFTVFADLNVYDAPVYFKDQPVSIQGQALMRKAYGYTIRRFDLGNDAFGHIAKEIQKGERGINFWVKGHQDSLNFKALLDSRIAIAKGGYNTSYGEKWGFALVSMPKYQFGAYNPKAGVDGNAMPGATPVGAAPTAETVAASFGGAPVMPQFAPAAAPQFAPQTAAPSFVMPQAQVGGINLPGV